MFSECEEQIKQLGPKIIGGLGKQLKVTIDAMDQILSEEPKIRNNRLLFLVKFLLENEKLLTESADIKPIEVEEKISINETDSLQSFV